VAQGTGLRRELGCYRSSSRDYRDRV